MLTAALERGTQQPSWRGQEALPSRRAPTSGGGSDEGPDAARAAVTDSPAPSPTQCSGLERRLPGRSSHVMRMPDRAPNQRPSPPWSSPTAPREGPAPCWGLGGRTGKGGDGDHPSNCLRGLSSDPITSQPFVYLVSVSCPHPTVPAALTRSPGASHRGQRSAVVAEATAEKGCGFPQT